MEELAVLASDLPWEQKKDSPPGLRRKILRLGPDGRPRAALVRMEAGVDIGAHTHEHAENHYVLEGLYESQGREYPAGSYRFIPKHTHHGPFRSHGGALVLVVWES